MAITENPRKVAVNKSSQEELFKGDHESLIEKVLACNTEMKSRCKLPSFHPLIGNFFRGYYESALYKLNLPLNGDFYKIFDAVLIQEYFIRKNDLHSSYQVLTLTTKESENFINLYDQLFSTFGISFTVDTKIYAEVLKKNILIQNELEVFRNTFISNTNFNKVFLHDGIGYFNNKIIKPENFIYLKTLLNNAAISGRGILTRITQSILKPELRTTFINKTQVNFNDGINFLLRETSTKPKTTSLEVNIESLKSSYGELFPEDFLIKNDDFLKNLSETSKDLDNLPFLILDENFQMLNNFLNIDRVSYAKRNMVKWDSLVEAHTSITKYFEKFDVKNVKNEKEIHIIHENIENPYLNYKKGEVLNVTSDVFRHLYNAKLLEPAEYKLNWLKSMVFPNAIQTSKISNELVQEELLSRFLGTKIVKKKTHLAAPSLLYSTTVDCKIINIRFGEIDKILKKLYSLVFNPMSSASLFTEDFENMQVFVSGQGPHPIYGSSNTKISAQITGICEEGYLLTLRTVDLLKRLETLSQEYCQYENRTAYTKYLKLLAAILKNKDQITGVTGFMSAYGNNYTNNYIESGEAKYLPKISVKLNPVKSIEYFGNKEIKLEIAKYINTPNRGAIYLKAYTKPSFENSSKINLEYASANLAKKGIKDPIGIIHLNHNGTEYKFCIDDFEFYVQSVDVVKLKPELFFKVEAKTKLSLVPNKTKFKVMVDYGNSFKEGDIVTYLSTTVPTFLAYNSGAANTKKLTPENFIEVKNDQTGFISYIQFKNINPYVEVKKKVSRKAVKKD